MFAIPVHRQGDAIAEVELEVDERQLSLDGGSTDLEGLRDLWVGVGISDEAGDLLLAGRQRTTVDGVSERQGEWHT